MALVMNSQNVKVRRQIGLWLGLAGLVFVGACGTSETTYPDPNNTNPYAEAQVGTDTTLDIATWNLENYAKNGSTTVELVRQAMLGMDADIIALQEIEYSTGFRDLYRGIEGWDGYRADGASYDINLAFLYKTSGSLEVTNIYEILGEYGREFPRTPLVLEGTFNDHPFVVIDNHLKCCGDNELDEGNAWDEETRRRDACLLLQQYAADNYADRAVVIVGDFNDEVTDNGSSNVFANFLNDTQGWRIADLAIAEDNTALWSYPGWPSHLDHVIISSPMFAAFEDPAATIRVVPLHEFSSGGWGGYDRDISDHLPVAISLKF